MLPSQQMALLAGGVIHLYAQPPAGVEAANACRVGPLGNIRVDVFWVGSDSGWCALRSPRLTKR